MGLSIKNLRKPRPFWAKAVGNTLMIAGNSTGLAALFATDSKLAVAVPIVIGTVGFFFTDLYKQADEEYSKQEAAEMVIEETRTTKVTTNVSDKPATDA